MSLSRISSGIDGLDQVLFGGFLHGRVYLIEGKPGVGKTIFGNQICFHHVKSGGRAVFMTLLAESHDQMLKNLSTLHFFDEKAVSQSLNYVSAYAVMETQGLQALLKCIAETQRKFQTTLLVIDGFAIVQQFAKNNVEYWTFIHRLSAFLHLSQCTTLILSPSKESILLPEYILLDGIINLDLAQLGLRTEREIEVYKSRGSDYLKGKHSYEITEKGLSIFPRLEQLFRQISTHESKPTQTRCSFTSSTLTKMLDGGIPSSSTTIVLGASGTGKTLLGLDFLVSGARRGEVGLHFGFYENASRLIAMGDRIDLNLSEHINRETIQMIWHAPLEHSLDKLGQTLLRKIQEKNVKRLFIDGADALKESATYPERISRFLAALSNQLRNLGVTTLITEETSLFSRDIEYSATHMTMSAVMENTILLRYVEVRSRLHRLISIIKVRGSTYDPSIREFRISNHGIEVASSFESAESLLTGSPRLVSSSKQKAPVHSLHPLQFRDRRRKA